MASYPTPFSTWRELVMPLLIQIVASAPWNKTFTMFMNSTAIPIFSNTMNKKPQLTLSYAFTKSSLTKTKGWLDCQA